MHCLLIWSGTRLKFLWQTPGFFLLNLACLLLDLACANPMFVPCRRVVLADGTVLYGDPTRRGGNKGKDA